MRQISDIVIVGGGLNGLSLALALGQDGHRVTVIDRLAEKVRKNARFDGRSYAIALGSQRLLSAIGVWSELREHAQPTLEIKVTDGRAGEGPSPFFLQFDHAEIEEGPMGYMVEDRHIRRVLLERVGASDHITHLAGETVDRQSLSAQHASVTLSSGQEITCDLLIGADGKNSGIATRAGIKRTAWDYAQSALVCAVEHDKPHHGIAHQFFMPPGPLAILPLQGNRSSIVWSETRAEATRVQALPDTAYLDHLRPRFGSFLGEIKLAGDRYSYPLGLSLAQSFIAERLALVGDAAHSVHPIAGQGLNAGLRDIAALAQVLSEARMRGEDIGSAPVLERYQSWRRFDATTLAMATDGFNRLFSNDNPLLRGLRDLGMGAVQALPGLRRGFIREAAGLTGALPKLMQAP